MSKAGTSYFIRDEDALTTISSINLSPTDEIKPSKIDALCFLKDEISGTCMVVRLNGRKLCLDCGWHMMCHVTAEKQQVSTNKSVIGAGNNHQPVVSHITMQKP